jgi:hypothetical protein
MLCGEARGWHSWNFSFYEDGLPIAATTLFSSWEAGELFLGEARFRIYREQVTSGAFVLEGEGVRIARAGTLYAQPGSIGIECDGNSFELRAESASSRRFILSKELNPIGSVYPEHPFTKKCIVDLPAELSLPVRLFIAWLVIVFWKIKAEDTPM